MTKAEIGKCQGNLDTIRLQGIGECAQAACVFFRENGQCHKYRDEAVIVLFSGITRHTLQEVSSGAKCFLK